MTKKKPVFPDEEATNLHTDMEITPDAGVGSEDGAEELKNAPLPQTDSEKEVSDEAATIEPESAPRKKPGRKRKKDITESESDDTPVSTPEAATSAAPKPKKRRTVKLVQEVISIDDKRTVETDEDKEKNDLLDLTESLKAGRILTGTVQGVEKTSDDAIAVI